MDDSREVLAELVARLRDHLGDELRALYLFGSLALGGFVPGSSDLDVLAVLDRDLDERELEPLRELHERFVADHPAWVERIEVGYASTAVLQSFAGQPRGPVVVICPGEPLHVEQPDTKWMLNWHGLVRGGETLYGPSPLELGPPTTVAAFEAAVLNELESWQRDVRDQTVAYVPAKRGYIVATLCRALYGLATGEPTTKEHAVEWVAERHPEWAAYVRDQLAAYRADVSEAHAEAIRFAEEALAEGRRLSR